MIAAPGTVADGVLNGFPIVPSPIAFPGLLTPGDPFDPKKPNPGPVSLALGLARGLGAVLTPQLGAVNFRAPEETRVVTIDVNVSREAAVADPKPLIDSPKEVQDLDTGSNLDEGTNQQVMAGVSGPDEPEATKPRPRIFGGNAGAQGAGGAGLSTLRQGIRDGIREFRDGVRDAVKTVTGRRDGRAGAGEGSAAESSGQ
jgi:hypothetical protein